MEGKYEDHATPEIACERGETVVVTAPHLHFMKKGCLIAVAVGLAFIAIVLFFVFALTSGAVTAGNTFLSQIGSGKIADAYESASETLKSQQTVGDFEESIKKLGLADYASASWNDRQTENGRGRLGGTVTTRSGGTIPLQMELVKEAGKWKVFKLSAPEAGVVVEPSGKSVPPEEKTEGDGFAVVARLQ